MYKNLTIPRWALLLTGLFLLPAVPVDAAEKGELRLDYRREDVKRPETARPAARTLPEELSIEMEGEAEKTRIPEKRSGATVSTQPLYYGKLAEEARDAASWAVHEVVENTGRREAYSLGFYDGLHAALDDPHLGRWDYRDGLERGRRARDAERLGSDLGYGAARESAERAASDEVSGEFLDLAREPRRSPHVPAPPMTADLYEARPPLLEEVFRDHPAPFEAISDPWTYYRRGSRRAFYDRDWWKASRAFELWVKGHRSCWKDLGEVERDYFENVFVAEYRRRISRDHAQVSERAYRHGFDNGWDYGAQVVYDWNYRQGYHEGWHVALRHAAEAAFRRTFPPLYAERYEAYFDEWSTSAHPEIRRLELYEENDDGVFEPGEAIWVDYEIANYGGAPGRFEIGLDGGVLARRAGDVVELPRRAIRSSTRPLASAIDESVAPRATAELAFTAAGLERRLPVRVSYPLEILGRPRLVDHDSLAGRAVIEATVKNASRRAVAGQVALKSAEVPREPVPWHLGEIGAGELRRVTFELAGLQPLDLLAGDVQVDLEVTSRGRRQDEIHDRLPALALDLHDRALLLFMESLARRGRPSSANHEVRRAQELMLQRLEADWKAVVADKGNAYKTDLKKRTRSTALGDLVWTFRSGRGALAHPEVFTALGPRIERLVEELPGTHPFLRKSARKLARQLEG